MSERLKVFPHAFGGYVIGILIPGLRERPEKLTLGAIVNGEDGQTVYYVPDSGERFRTKEDAQAAIDRDD